MVTENFVEAPRSSVEEYLTLTFSKLETIKLEPTLIDEVAERVLVGSTELDEE